MTAIDKTSLQQFYYYIEKKGNTNLSVEKMYDIVDEVFIQRKFYGAEVKRIDENKNIIYFQFDRRLKPETVAKELSEFQNVELKYQFITFKDQNEKQDFESYKPLVSFFQIYPITPQTEVTFAEIKTIIESCIFTKFGGGVIEYESKPLKTCYVSFMRKISETQIQSHLKTRGFNLVRVEKIDKLPTIEEVKKLEKIRKKYPITQD